MTTDTTPNGTGAWDVLVATDFSTSARTALDWAIDIAETHGGRLHLLHVVETYDVPIHVPLETQDLVSRGVAEHLGELERACRDRGVEVTAECRTGKPWKTIVEVEHERAPHLLVVGARGNTAYAGLLLGSTADRVLRFARAPVLTVHPTDAGRPETCRTVLVATDFSEESSLATSMALGALPACPDARRLVLLHVCQTPVFFETEAVAATVCRQIQDDEAAARHRLETLAASLRSDRLVVETVARPGDPAMAIEEEARAAGADLIAVGTHGRAGFRHLLLGSVAERVVHHAPCPVLTVRRPDDKSAVRLSDADVQRVG